MKKAFSSAGRAVAGRSPSKRPRLEAKNDQVFQDSSLWDSTITIPRMITTMAALSTIRTEDSARRGPYSAEDPSNDPSTDDGDDQHEEEEQRRRLEEKRESMRRNAARARLRNKEQLSDLIQQVDDLENQLNDLERQKVELEIQLNDVRKENKRLYDLLLLQQQPQSRHETRALPPTGKVGKVLPGPVDLSGPSTRTPAREYAAPSTAVVATAASMPRGFNPHHHHHHTNPPHTGPPAQAAPRDTTPGPEHIQALAPMPPVPTALEPPLPQEVLTATLTFLLQNNSPLGLELLARLLPTSPTAVSPLPPVVVPHLSSNTSTSSRPTGSSMTASALPNAMTASAAASAAALPREMTAQALVALLEASSPAGHPPWPLARVESHAGPPSNAHTKPTNTVTSVSSFLEENNNKNKNIVPTLHPTESSSLSTFPPSTWPDASLNNHVGLLSPAFTWLSHLLAASGAAGPGPEQQQQK